MNDNINRLMYTVRAITSGPIEIIGVINHLVTLTVVTQSVAYSLYEGLKPVLVNVLVP